MSEDPWYAVVGPAEPITQGDVIADCPLLGWDEPATPEAGQTVTLSDLARPFAKDVIVMTQACDLANLKVRNVVLCPTVELPAFRDGWEAQVRSAGQNPTAKAWRGTLEAIAAGRVWELSLLDRFTSPELDTDIRVVFFSEVYTLPRSFLDRLLAGRGRSRLRLRPPYREHLSQSFARFFMRVGLPQAISLPT
jgi:hypothetical protein